MSSEATMPLPAILCLHGHGSNGAIFKLQARRIVAELSTRFRFIFIDAPFESPPGPGVQPAFTDLGPFFRWHCDADITAEFDVTPEDVTSERRRTRSLLAAYFDRETASGGQGIVGIMAFSQGTRVATGLCLDRELMTALKFAVLVGGQFPVLGLTTPREDDDGHDPTYSDKKTRTHPDTTIRSDEGIASSSSSSSSSLSTPAISADDLPSLASSENRSENSKCVVFPVVHIPSIHIQGTADPWAAQGVRLRQTYYDPKSTTIIKFRGGHQVPTGANEAKIIAGAVGAAWQDH